jgi:hypothetical protein
VRAQRGLWESRRVKLTWALYLSAFVMFAAALVLRLLPGAGPGLAAAIRGLIGDATADRMGLRGRSLSDNPGAESATARLALNPLPAIPHPEPEPSHAEPRAEPPSAPEPLRPPFPNVAANGDGEWTPVLDPEQPDAPQLLYKTRLHPDPQQSRAELFLVAMPTDHVRLQAVPGTLEPETTNPAAARLEDRGLIPASDQSTLLAGFNGGFRSMHGHHGMTVQGVVIAPLRPDMCTISAYADGSLRIRSWKPQNETADAALWSRQTSRCLVEDGTLHPALKNADTKAWGATLEGETTIRRSALAQSHDGTRLLIGMSNFTNARALAVGMQAAGGWEVAQLDVNWGYPKFLLFPRDASGQRYASTLFSGFSFKPEDMVKKASQRDFFYVVRK